MMEVTLGSRLFGLQGNGDDHIVDEIEGWFDGPDVNHAVLQRLAEDGVIITDSTYAGRPLLIKGYSIPGPGRTGFHAQEFLRDKTDIVHRSSLLVVNEPPAAGGPKQARVRKAARTRIRPRLGHVEWQIPLLADDPRLYSTVLTDINFSVDPGGVDKVDTGSTLNAGNFTTYPEQISIYGTGEPPIRVQKLDFDTDEVLAEIILTENLGGSNRYEIFPQTREVRYGDAAAGPPRNYDVVDDATVWWQINADNEPTKIRLRRSNAAAGSMTAQFRYRSAWV